MFSTPVFSSQGIQRLSNRLSRNALFLRPLVSSGPFSSSSSSSSSRSPSTNPNYLDLEKIRQELLQAWITAETESPGGGTMYSSSRCGCFTYYDAVRIYRDKDSPWHWLDREMSSNLAGETGAVAIYSGALAALNVRPHHYSTSPGHPAMEFCRDHQANERIHLQYFQSVVPDTKRTRLLWLWKMAGWMLGFSATFWGGTRGLYVTVEAVETFVEEHFQEQIVPLREQGNAPELLRLLEFCCEEEVHHKEDAARRLLDLDNKNNAFTSSDFVSAWWVKPWTKIVRNGSALAAEMARRI